MIYVGGGTPAQTKQNTEQYLNGFKDGNVRIMIRIGDLSDFIDLNEDDISMSGGITVTSVLNPDTDMTYGTVSATELVMHIIKSNKTSAIDWSQPITLYASTKYNNQQLMYNSFGQFYGSEIKQVVENGLDVYVYTGYEITASYNVDASDFISTLTFPMTGQELADALCAYCGYSFAIGTRAGTMMTSYVISQNPFPSSCTLKDIFRWIAEANGAYIHMGGYAQISTVVFNKPFYGIEYTLTKDDYFAPLNKAHYNVPPVPAVCYVDSTNPNKNEQYPSTYNGIPYTINDNPILRSFTNAEISTILSDIKSKMNYGGDVYVPVLTPIKVTAVGNPFVQVGDIINIVDQDDNTIPFYIYSRTFRWNGAATDEYECTGNAVRQAMTDEEKTVYQVKQVVSNTTANCERKVLLWKNSSSSTFNAQTLNIDFTGYDGFEVYTLHGHGKQMFDAQNWIVTYYVSGLGNNSFYTCARTFTVANDMKSLAVSNCGYTYRDGGAGSNNSLHVPMLIYGIKLG